MTEKKHEYKEVALQFAKAITNRDYSAAYAMTSREYQQRTSLDQMRRGFEHSCPLDYGSFGPIFVGETMENWPNKKHSDIGRAYVNVGGQFNEAVTVIITLENGILKIREVEFGRP